MARGIWDKTEPVLSARSEKRWAIAAVAMIARRKQLVCSYVFFLPFFWAGKNHDWIFHSCLQGSKSPFLVFLGRSSISQCLPTKVILMRW